MTTMTATTKRLAVRALALAARLLPAPAGAVPTCRGEAATIVVAQPGQTPQGSDGRDVVVGTAGDDVVVGNGGDDLVCLGDGDDEFRAWGPPVQPIPDGADEVHGGRGADRL